jgi:adenylyltransferase/sulfurtransferase
VLIVGVGGLGCPAALALAAAGVRRITLCDPDRVDLSNLHRQILYTEADVGELKVLCARRALAAAFPDLAVEAVAARCEAALAADLIAGHDVVLEGTDDIATKFAVSDSAVTHGRFCVVGGAVGFTGQVLPWGPHRAAGCYRCLFEAMPEGDMPTCGDAGVLGAVCGVVGALMARAALAGLGAAIEDAPAPGHVYLYDALAARLRAVPVRQSPHCPLPHSRVSKVCA